MPKNCSVRWISRKEMLWRFLLQNSYPKLSDIRLIMHCQVMTTTGDFFEILSRRFKFFFANYKCKTSLTPYRCRLHLVVISLRTYSTILLVTKTKRSRTSLHIMVSSGDETLTVHPSAFSLSSIPWHGSHIHSTWSCLKSSSACNHKDILTTAKQKNC